MFMIIKEERSFPNRSGREKCSQKRDIYDWKGREICL